MHLMGWSMVLSYSRATSLNSYVSLPSWMSCDDHTACTLTLPKGYPEGKKQRRLTHLVGLVRVNPLPVARHRQGEVITNKPDRE